MTATPLDAGFEYYLIVLHPAEHCVLFLREAHRLTLPNFVSTETDMRTVRHINAAALRLTGLKTSVMRCVATKYKTSVSGQRYFALEALGIEGLSDYASWLTEDQINDRASIPPYQKALLREYFTWSKSTTRLRAPWEQRGWFKMTQESMLDIADRVDMLPEGDVEQQSVWARSSVTRLETRQGTLFFKAVPPLFSYEPVVTRVLSLRYPNRVPEVLAVNVAKSWMLIREGKGIPLGESQRLEDWKRAIQQFAEIQIDLSDSTHSLVAVGLPDRNVDYLHSQIDRLMIDLPSTLDEEEKQALRRAAFALKMMCYDLLEYKVPLSLTHGDLWSEHIRVLDDGSIQFANWSDSSVSHPFFDVPIFLADIENELPGVPDARKQLLQTYLELWTDYEPMHHLRRAYAAAEVLSKLQQVVNYQQFILPAVEQAARHEMQHIVPAFLRQILVALKSYTIQ
jgi:hypothetical protein